MAGMRRRRAFAWGVHVDSVIGRYARSKAGRDKDRLFIITGIVDEAHVQVADGEVRRVDRPKKKKLRHLDILEDTCTVVADILAARRRLLDADLRKAIRAHETPQGSEPERQEG